jgi:hypothetical protein
LRYQRLRNGRMKFAGEIDPEAAEEFEGLLGELAKPQPLAKDVPDPRPRLQRYGDTFTDTANRCRFYKSLLISFLADRINPHLVKWAMRKFKHLHRAPAKARRRIAQIATQYRGMFVHWRHGALPAGSTTGAV